jgi:cytochrome P450
MSDASSASTSDAERDEAVAALGMDYLDAQPHGAWKVLREKCPVKSLPMPDGERPVYMVMRHDDIESVMRDPATFSNAIHNETMGPVMGEIILGMDGQEHKDHRDLVARAFRASTLAKWDKELIEPAINGLIDEIAPLGRADLVESVTSRYPVQVIAGIVGVPGEDYPIFQQWAQDITSIHIDPERAIVASQAMADYLLPIVHDRREHPTDDLISDLVTAEVHGTRLTDERILGFLRLLLPAGAETTFRAMGNCLVALLTHPEAMKRVAADHALLPSVIEETLRWETSVTIATRNAITDTEVAGCPIPADAVLLLMNSSAGRDASHYEHPDEWDIDRKAANHLFFGTGRHQCLGMHLARLELRVGLGVILDRLPRLRLDPDAPPPAIEGFAFRSPLSIPVLFD